MTFSPVTDASFDINVGRGQRPPVDNLEADVTLTPDALQQNSTAAKTNTAGLEIRARQLGDSSQVSGNTLRPERTTFWDGKKIVLTETMGTTTGPQPVGHTEEEWVQIAAAIVAMLDEKKRVDPTFTLSAASLNAQTGIFKYRPHGNGNVPVQTDDLHTNTALSSIRAQADNVRNVLARCPGGPIRYTNRPPKVNQAGTTAAPQPAAATTPAANGQVDDPLHPTIPPDNRSLPRRAWDKVRGIFN